MAALTKLTPALRALLATLEGVLTPAVERTQLSPGTTPAWDSGCGQLSISVTGATPVYGRMRANGGYCAATRVDVNIAIELVRCVAVLSDQGRAPTAAEVTEDTVQEILDLDMVDTALKCFDWAAYGVDNAKLVSWSLNGPNAGQLGLTWNVSLSIPEL